MATGKRSGLFGRFWGLLGRALDWLLGKSTHKYRKKFTGNDAFWENVIASQSGWQQKQPGDPLRNGSVAPRNQ